MVEHIGALRGQPITLEIVPLPRTTTGLSVFCEDSETIFVNADAEPLHRVLIILHEVWHQIEDLTGPPLLVCLWRRSVTRPLERCGLRQPRPSRSAFGDHSVFDLDNLHEVLDALPREMVDEVIAHHRPVKMRGDHNHGYDPAEVFARQMLQMLALDDDASGTGAMTASLDHRRIGI